MARRGLQSSFFFFNDTATTEIYTLSLHDALPISVRFQRVVGCGGPGSRVRVPSRGAKRGITRARVVRQRSRVAGYQTSDEHTCELQSLPQIARHLLLDILQVALRVRHLRLRTLPQ